MKRALLIAVSALALAACLQGPPPPNVPTQPTAIPGMGLTIDLPAGFAVTQTNGSVTFTKGGFRWGPRVLTIDPNSNPVATATVRIERNRELSNGGNVAYWVKDTILHRQLNSELTGTLDFQGKQYGVTCLASGEAEDGGRVSEWCLAHLATLR